jgi:hypothetical protein
MIEHRKGIFGGELQIAAPNLPGRLRGEYGIANQWKGRGRSAVGIWNQTMLG